MFSLSRNEMESLVHIIYFGHVCGSDLRSFENLFSPSSFRCQPLVCIIVINGGGACGDACEGTIQQPFIPRTPPAYLAKRGENRGGVGAKKGASIQVLFFACL